MEHANAAAYTQKLSLLPDFKVISRVQIMAEVQDYNIRMMNIPAMWKLTKGGGAKLAILDSGIPNHPDIHPCLSKSFIPGYSEDLCGHATHCGGIAAAIGGNGMGVIGVAPEVEDSYGAVLDGDGSGDINTIIQGIRWAVDELGADVISMSLGIAAGAPHFRALEDACNYAVSHGVTVICAAGNESGAVGQPGCYDSVLGIAAVNDRMQHASFSDFGPEVDFAAGGVDVYSCYLQQSYAKLSGTSMATPAIAGLVSLIIAHHKAKGEKLTPAEVKEHLKRIAYNADGDNYDELIGYGIPIFQNNEDPEEGPTTGTPVQPPVIPPPVEPTPPKAKKAGLPQADCAYWKMGMTFINDIGDTLDAHPHDDMAMNLAFKEAFLTLRNKMNAMDKLVSQQVEKK